MTTDAEFVTNGYAPHGGYRQVGECQHCESGTLVSNGPETYCRNCYTVVTPPPRSSLARRQRRHRERRHGGWRWEQEEYESGVTKLPGGFTHRGYIAGADGDKEYALDHYDDVTDGLWTPHDRYAD